MKILSSLGRSRIIPAYLFRPFFRTELPHDGFEFDCVGGQESKRVVLRLCNAPNHPLCDNFLEILVGKVLVQINVGSGMNPHPFAGEIDFDINLKFVFFSIPN